ncbi:MAG: zinc-binding dehydrogenase [Candidatus Sericytochromatia bacterium]|nr:zinc-binding dehydrogenase [Candidatus Sericytochromatia bacterium]
MQVVEIVGRGGPACLQLREKPDPTPGPGGGHVADKAAGVNFADIMGRRGLYRDAPKGDFVPGYEVSGIVDAVGPGVTAFAPGDRVMGMTKFHGYASRVVTTENHLMAIPEGWDFVRAAAVPVVYLTAYTALIRQARVQRGDRVLIHAAAGGVGVAAIQIARHAGARIAGSCGSQAKVDFLRELGVEWPINYNTEPFDDFVRRELGAVDIILDAQGGDTTARGLKILEVAGRLVLYGIASSATERGRNPLTLLKTIFPLLKANPITLMAKNTGVFGLNMLNTWDDKPGLKMGFAWLQAAMASGVVDPVIDATFPLAKAAEAQGRLENRSNIGKVVLTVDG